MTDAPGHVGASARTLRSQVSRIGVRLLMFNLLAVMMPVAGILYLDVYEQELLNAQERGMIDQARLTAAALGGSTAIPPDEAARTLLANLTPGDARIRVIGLRGDVIADSARVARRPPPASGDTSPAPPTDATREEWLYRLGSWMATLRHRLRPTTAPDSTARSARPDDGAVATEIQAALKGRFGAATRPSRGQRSLTMTVALPIVQGGEVAGAVAVSQSTIRILRSLYVVRLRIFRIVVATLALAAVISAILTWTIVRPIRQLRRATPALAHGHRPPVSPVPGIDRHDEIGDLARALDDLTRRLQAHVALLEAFAGDVAHELRNPLTSIRAAIDVVRDAEDPTERARFVSLMRRDIDRLDRLVTGVGDLARLDRAIESDVLESVDVNRLARNVGDQRYAARQLQITNDALPLLVRAHPDRLAQVLENLIDNAVSFSPDPGSVVVSLHVEGRWVVVGVADRGPGIPENHRERVFERFFSYRPGTGTARHEHAGLGLAIARAIVEAYHGTIAARPRDGGGTMMEVRVPRVEV